MPDTSLRKEVLTPDDVVALLEQALCTSSCSVSKTLREVTPRLSCSHPSVTEAALPLIELYPHETIPYVPDLISDDAQDTTIILELFSTLLQTDRSLLVPIIATLPDLHLTASHVLHARSTLSFALRIVEEPDLPAVVRALIRSADSSSSSEWASRSIRTGLSRSSLQPSICPLIAQVFQDALHSSCRIFKSLRQHSASPFLWVDLLTWILSFSSTISSPVPQREALSSLQHAILKMGILHDIPRIHSHLRLIHQVLHEHPGAVHRFIMAIVSNCPSRLSDVVGCIHLIRDCLVACPSNVVNAVTCDLACDTRPITPIILRALLSSGISLPQINGSLSYCIPLFCEYDMQHNHNGTATTTNSSTTINSEIWSPIFIKIRKGLVFGNEEQKTYAIQLASDIIKNDACIPVVNEVMTLMNDCITCSLAEDCAIDLLCIFKEAIIKQMIDPKLIRNIFNSRILSQCPDKCFEEEDDNEGGRAIGIKDAMLIKIDIGLIWNQLPSASSIITSSGVLCYAYNRCSTSTDNLDMLSFHILNVTVLVPVVCVSLYEAVAKINDEIDDHSGLVCNRNFQFNFDQFQLPDEILQMDIHDIVKAISAFGVGISVIIGIINTASKSLNSCKRIIDRRSKCENDQHETNDHKATWALLERLTELHRMLNALTLGHEILMRKNRNEKLSTQLLNNNSNINNSKRRKQSYGTQKNRKYKNGKHKSNTNIIQSNKKIFTIQEALIRAEAVVSNVTSVLFGSELSPDQSQHSTELLRHRFPSLRLESIIAALAAVPDDSEMYENVTISARDRDIELVQMDKFLLRLLLRIIREGSNVVENRRNVKPILSGYNHEIVPHHHQQQKQQQVQNANKEQNDENDTTFSKYHNYGPRFDLLTDQENDNLLEMLGKQLDKEKNIIHELNETENSTDDIETLEKSDACDIRWAKGTLSASKDISMEYLNDSVLSLSNENDQVIHAADILHSPTFAALLLDRAATSTTVSRNARLKSMNQDDIRDLVQVSAMALSCLSLILRELPGFYESFALNNNGNENVLSNHWEAMKQFIECVNSNLLTNLPDSFLHDSRCNHVNCDDDFQRFSRVFYTLEWIRITTPDTIVSITAMDVMLTLSELDIFPIVDVRSSVFQSLSTIYEYDGHSLWDWTDLSLVLDDPFYEWLIRRRGRLGFLDSNRLEDGLFESADNAPWVELKKRNIKTNGIEHHRLTMLFGGMNISMATLEACAWIHEFSQVIQSSSIAASTSSVSNESKFQKSSKNNKISMSKQFDKDVNKKNFQICDVLLDMIGLRTILSLFLQLVHQGFQSFPVDESLSEEHAHDEIQSPLYSIGLTLRLFSGIQELYQRNYEALCTTTSSSTTTKNKKKLQNKKLQDFQLDELFENEIINGYISSLRHLYKRIEELYQWYSNESIQISELDEQCTTQIHHIIGGSIIVVGNCVQITEIMRNERSKHVDANGLNNNNNVETNHSKQQQQRKRPRYLKGKRTKMNDNKLNQNSTSGDFAEDGSKGWKLLPRLAYVCDQVRKSSERLARSMGIKSSVKLSTLASEPITNDRQLRFGIGIKGDNLNERNEHGYHIGQDDDDDDDDESIDEFVEPAASNGFHARGADSNPQDNDSNSQVKTISVQFKRRGDSIEAIHDDDRVMR